MAIDPATFAIRLRALLPKGWFSDDAPILGAILASFAVPWAWLSETLDYVKSQARLETATDIWLDLAARDYLGLSCVRLTNESDDTYRARIKSNLLAGAVTKQSVVQGINRIAGLTAHVFEPANISDTGAYGALNGTAASSGNGLAYGTKGGWGNLALPYQVFITIETSPEPGEPAPTGYGIAGGGYSAGSFAYNTLATLPGSSTDDDARRVVRKLLPTCCTAWLRFI